MHAKPPTLLPLLFLLIAAIANPDSDTFTSPKAGITVTKPAGWVFDETHDRTNGPIVVITRHKEPHPDRNPTCLIALKSSEQTGGKDPTQQAVAHIKTMKNRFKDLGVVDGPRDVTVAGIKGTFVKAVYTLRAKGKTEKVFARKWIVPVSSGTLEVTMAGPQQGPEVSEKEFKAIVDSIEVRSP